MSHIIAIIAGIVLGVALTILDHFYGNKKRNSSDGSRFGGDHRKKHPGKCSGDCDRCPAHYGYRYGRWYYGHGHQHGCQLDGNGGASGKTYRD